MSIIPTNNQQSNVSNTASSDIWDHFLDFPFRDFPFPFPPLSHAFPEFDFGSSVNTRLDWRETANAHVLKAVLPGFSNEDVLVGLLDDRMLQVSTESGSFMTRFKLPENAKLEGLNAFMDHGILTVTVPKEEVNSANNNVRVIEISGE